MTTTTNAPDYIPPEVGKPHAEDPNAERSRHLRTGVAGPYVPAPRPVAEVDGRETDVG
jgi:hypothetical protein